MHTPLKLAIAFFVNSLRLAIAFRRLVIVRGSEFIQDIQTFRCKIYNKKKNKYFIPGHGKSKLAATHVLSLNGRRIAPSGIAKLAWRGYT
jgi:hypothetical protein